MYDMLQRMKQESNEEKRSSNEQGDILRRRLRNLKQKCTQLEHGLKKKDDTIVKMRKKLEAVVRMVFMTFVCV